MGPKAKKGKQKVQIVEPPKEAPVEPRSVTALQVVEPEATAPTQIGPTHESQDQTAGDGWGDTGVGWGAGDDTTAADNANGWNGEEKWIKSPRKSPAVVGNNLTPGTWGAPNVTHSAGSATQEWGGQPTVSPAAGAESVLPNMPATPNGLGDQSNIPQLHRALRGAAANDTAAHPLVVSVAGGGFMAGGSTQTKAALNGIQQADSSKGGKKLKKTNSVHAPPPQQVPVPPPPPSKTRDESWRDARGDGWGGTGGGDGWDDTYAPGDYDDYDEEEEEGEEEEEEEWEALPPAPPPPTQSRAPPPARAPSASVAAYQKAAWSKWHNEARGLPKVTTSANALPFVSPAASSASGNRPVLSQQQRSRTLASLLSHPTQTKGTVTQSQGNQYQAVPSVQPALRHTQQAQSYGQLTDAAALQRHLMNLQQQQQQQMQQQFQMQQQVQMQQQAQLQQQAQMQQGGGRGINKAGHQQYQHAAQQPPRPQKIQQEESWGAAGGWGGGWNEAIPEENEEEESYRGDDQDDGGWGADGGWTADQDDGGWGPVADNGGWGGGHEDKEQSRKHGGKKHRDRGKKGRKDRDGGWSGSQAGGGWGGSQAGGGWGDSQAGGGWDDSQAGRWDQEADGWDNGQEGRGYQDGVSNKKATPARTPRTLPPTQLPTFSGPTSKTMDMATGKMTTVFELTAPRNGMGENTFVDSHGMALQYAERALYSRSRPTKERIHWSFNPDKDPRVSSLLRWIDAMANGLVTIGLERFLKTGERGALISNADYRSNDVPNSPAQPAFDWLTLDQLQGTMDKVFQESVAYYDPEYQVVVFVFLLSKTGNSMAVWRRKLTVPESLRYARRHEIRQRRETLIYDYPIYVDEIPVPPSIEETKKKRRGFLCFHW